MTSDKPDPITNFLQAHKKPLTKEEQAALKAKERKRRVRAQAANLNWKNNDTPMHDRPRDVLQSGVQPDQADH
jgi:hypothetical protein